MFIYDTLPFVRNYIDEIDGALKAYDENAKLTNSQKAWLGFCIMAIFVTRTFCWAKFERACLGARSSAALSWMFRWSAIPWQILLAASTVVVIGRFGIIRCRLVLDETDKKRSKSAKLIHNLHKIKDKASGGYINGQKLVFLYLVADNVSIPVGFEFYKPDPELKSGKRTTKSSQAGRIEEKPSSPNRREIRAVPPSPKSR